MKVLIIGARGQLGSDLVRACSEWDAVPRTHADMDVCDAEATRRTIEHIRPDAVINTAAFHRVEECEAQPEQAFAVNCLAARNLARACADCRCALVHLSTDYVFAGDRNYPYAETDPAVPVNVYGASKLAGEHLVRQSCPRHFVVRTSGLYGVAGSSGKGGNFVELMVRLAREGKPIRVVNDQVLTPTYTKDLAHKIKELVQTTAYGLYHVTNTGQCSWHEFAAEIFYLLNVKPDFAATTTAAFGARVQRPGYSVLAHHALAKIKSEDLRPWHQALLDYLREKGHLQSSRALVA
jgi:dTDP-4-dehydrorhamnose reductase